MASCGILGYLLFLYRAYEITDTQTAYILQRLWPVFVIIFSITLLGERIQLKHVLGFLLCILGSIILIGGFTFSIFSSGLQPWGIFLALSAAVSYGLYSTLGKKYDEDRATSMLIYYSIAFILLIPMVLVENKPIPPITMLDLFGFFWVGGLVLGVGDLSWFLALKYGDTTKMTSISFLSPALALFWIYFLLDETIRYSSIVGMVIILIGIYINQNDSPSKNVSPT
jgi:drug/metabolite transporter (DMT)-like permease